MHKDTARYRFLFLFVLLLSAIFGAYLYAVSSGVCLSKGKRLSNDVLVRAALHSLKNHRKFSEYAKAELAKQVPECCKVGGEFSVGHGGTDLTNKVIFGKYLHSVVGYFPDPTPNDPNQPFSMTITPVSACGEVSPGGTRTINVSRGEYDSNILK